MITLWVLRENSYSASTIRTMADQRVISSGPYAFIRHPMYLGALIMVLGVPPALGSCWGLMVALANVPILVLRILDEEKMLRAELAGYDAYAARVRFRLLPGIW